MADSISTSIVEALQRALMEPDGLPLLSSKQAPGLFAGNAAGKQAASDARAAGLLQVSRTEARGKATNEYFALTEKGLACLLDRMSPRPVLEALLEAMTACQKRVEQWVADVERNRDYLANLRGLAETVLAHMQKPEATLPPWARNGHGQDPQALIVASLNAWHASGQVGDCPLPDLYERVRATSSRLTLGGFHDALRALHEQRSIYLHPWTGPLHELPRPALSLLVGHEVAYYASLRNPPVQG